MIVVKQISLLVFSILFSGQGIAMNEDLLSTAEAEKISQYFQTAGVEGSLDREKGVTINYRRFDSSTSNKALIILPGWSEPKKKYAELIYDLRLQGLNIYILDHRGQGSSSRQLKNSQISHVDYFNQYVDDLSAFDRHIVRVKNYQQVYILAHSMGGLIAAAYVSQHAEKFSALILNAPMFQVNTGFIPERLAYAISTVLSASGYGESYVPSHGEWRATAFADNQQTHSRVRFLRSEQIFVEQPEVIVSGVSNQWLRASIQTSWDVPLFAEKINIPVLLFQATQDTFVKADAQNQFCAINQFCEKVVVEAAKHEILMEQDVIREPVVQRIKDFIALH